jgi:hypothetical protein
MPAAIVVDSQGQVAAISSIGTTVITSIVAPLSALIAGVSLAVSNVSAAVVAVSAAISVQGAATSVVIAGVSAGVSVARAAVSAAISVFSAQTSVVLANISAAVSLNGRSNIKKNQAIPDFAFVMRVAGVPTPGLTPGIMVKLDGGAFTAVTNTPVSKGAGHWNVSLDASHVNANVVTFRATATGADDTNITIYTVP